MKAEISISRSCLRLYETKYSRINQVKYFKVCLPQILLGLFLNSLSKTMKQKYIQWTLSISTTLYLELLSISNKNLGPLDICVLSKLFLSLYLELLYLNFSLSRTKSWSLVTISLSILNFFPSKGPFTQQIEQKCLIFENSNVIKTFEIRKFDCNQNITKCKGTKYYKVLS